MPVKKVKGGYKIAHVKKLYTSKKEAERVSKIRESYKK